MSERKYRFVCGSNTNALYNLDMMDMGKVTLYQICGFPNPKTGKFEVREVSINGNNDIESYVTHHISDDTRKKLLLAMRDNKYRIYSMYTLKHVGLPSCSDISLARSGILNDDNDYSGFAQFGKC